MMVWHWLFSCFAQDVLAGAWAFISWNINVSTRDSKRSTSNLRLGKFRVKFQENVAWDLIACQRLLGCGHLEIANSECQTIILQC